MATIGTKIRKIRELKNLKQEHVAEKLGISVTAYGKIERDETDISIERLDQIAKVLEIAPQDILAFDERMLFQFLSSASQCGYTYNINNYGVTENERKLYEEKNQLLQDKICILDEKCDYLQKELERLKGK